jgi:hypothetical protein
VKRVLDKFAPMAASQSTTVPVGNIVQIVGRCVLAGTQPFYSPASNKPCIYYKVTVSEEREETRQDSEGNVTKSTSWHNIATDERQVDFYLQDGAYRVFIRGSDRSQTKIQSENDGGGRSGRWNSPPPGIRSMIGYQHRNRGSSYNFTRGHRGSTGRYKYTERCFEVNELVAALGVIQAGQDPYGQQVGILSAFQEDTLTEEWFAAQDDTENKWSSYDKQSWHSLFGRGAAVLLSDSTHFTGTVNVQPANVPTPIATVDYSWDQQWEYSEQSSVNVTIAKELVMER